MNFLNEAKNRSLFEIIGLFLALLAGLLPRIWFITRFPVEQISDFANLLAFAQALQHNVITPGWWWHFFAPGLPLILAGILNFFTSSSPNTIALWSTAVITGLVPLAPYVIWKNTFSWHVRIVAALLLGFWTSQVFFSNALAQDNWVLLPSIALGAFSIRAMANPDRSFPISGAILYSIATAIRQDMLVVLLPLVVTAWIGRNTSLQHVWRASVKGLIVLGITLGFLVIQRGLATGRYALSSEHLGASIAGAYVPGAELGWIPPSDYIQRTYPTAAEDEVDEIVKGLALQEFVRRPGFHIIRVGASAFYYLTNMDSLLWWSLPGTFSASATLWKAVSFHTLITHTLFLAALAVLARRREAIAYTWPLLLAILLKIGLHAVTVSQARFYLIVLGFEILLISLAIHALWMKFSPKLLGAALLTGIAGYSAIALAGNLSINYVRLNTWGIYQDEFRMDIAPINIQCKAKNSLLMYFTDTEAAFKFATFEVDPGDAATLICKARADEPRRLFLNIKDDYAGGGFPGRIIYVVEVNDTQVFQHDMAEGSWVGWIDNIELGYVGPDSPLLFTISLQAIQPDAGWNWGYSSSLAFKLNIQP